MNKFDRRSFIKVMGQSAVVMGLSQKDAFAAQAQAKETKTKKRPKRIAVEEHISSQDYVDYLSTLNNVQYMERIQAGSQAMPAQGLGNPPMQGGQMPGGNPPMQGGRGQSSVDVIGDIENIDMRIKDMDENGIDMQVLSWRNPGVEEFDTKNGLIWARKINDKLAGVVNKYPKRFAAFCSIPWQDQAAAITELERAMKELGLKGIKIDGTVNGEYLEAKKYWPIFKKAEELGAPIFIHVEDARAGIIKFYSEFASSSATMGAGRDLDVFMHACRLVSSGLFDEYPKLNFILGHMGAGLPFMAKRFGMERYVKENFYVATSGNFSQPALICSYMEMGADHVLFGVDFPSESNKEAMEFMEAAQIPESDKEKIYHLNAERVFGI